MESRLPKDVFIAWESSRNKMDADIQYERILGNLMNFLMKEVMTEEMVVLAHMGLELPITRKRENV